MDYEKTSSIKVVTALREWIVSRRALIAGSTSYTDDNTNLGRVMAYNEIIKKLEECDEQGNAGVEGAS